MYVCCDGSLSRSERVGQDMDEDDELLPLSRIRSTVIIVPIDIEPRALCDGTKAEGNWIHCVSKETPGDGSCMFHALLDQIQSNPSASLPPYADNHWELRYQIVLEGYEKFINKLDWPNDEVVGSKEAWKKKMTNLNAWDDEVVLQLVSNLA